MAYLTTMACLFAIIMTSRGAESTSPTSGSGEDSGTNSVTVIWQLDRVAEINCSWHPGNITSSQIEFEFNNRNLASDSARYHIIPMGDNLVQLIIIAPQPLDSGVYTCRAVLHGKSVIVDVVTLNVLVKPTANETSSRILGGTNATLRCPVKWAHGWTIHWLSNTGNPVYNTHKHVIVDNTLTIRYVGFRDSGKYRCLVFGSSGLTEGNVTIDVFGPPSRPLLLTNFNSNSLWEEAVIRWNVSFNGGSPITGSFMTCRGQQKQLDVQTMTFPANISNVHVPDLQLQKLGTYNCSLQLINVYGYSQSSSSVEVTYLDRIAPSVQAVTRGTTAAEQGTNSTMYDTPTPTRVLSGDDLSAVIYSAVLSFVGVSTIVIVIVLIRVRRLRRGAVASTNEKRDSTQTREDISAVSQETSVSVAAANDSREDIRTMDVVVTLCQTTLAEVRQCKHLAIETVNILGDCYGETAV